jgi:aconitate hydratase
MSAAPRQDPFGVTRTLTTATGPTSYWSLPELGNKLGLDLGRLPVTLRVILESALRSVDETLVTSEDVERIARWPDGPKADVPFMPARVLMQDFTGVPAIVDLAAMRDALATLGGDPERVNPLIPVDLVIDHSVQVDWHGSVRALGHNLDAEMRRNRERYVFLRWGASSFRGLRVIPPGTGICHQVNLEYLATVVGLQERDGRWWASPDSVVGTDSHTTMIDGIGVLGWGVGGIEAESVMLGRPYTLVIPDVIGFRLTGRLREGTTPTDLVLTITQMLRKYGVVDKLVEFFGPGVDSLSVPDRALVSNMSPEMGATALYFPVDRATLRYLELTGRTADHIALVEAYTRAQGLFREATSPEPRFTDVVELDLETVESSIAGPRRPQDRLSLGAAAGSIPSMLAEAKRSARRVAVELRGTPAVVQDGSVVIAAITSCTNTSSPTVMVAAGLLARKAVEMGLRVPPTVKTSLAPGSRVVTRYLDEAGLTPYLEALGFHLVGYGCTTCIGNSGPLDPVVSAAVQENSLVVAAVLSGNRNFEGRIHPDVRANYLASPPLVVAYALAGTMNIDLTRDPLSADGSGQDVYLRDIWPTPREINETVARVVSGKQYTAEYANVTTGTPEWSALPVSQGTRYPWSDASTYIRLPPFFHALENGGPGGVLTDARVLLWLGDSITTDHISPAGNIAKDSPAGRWLVEQGVTPEDFNSYGSRRGNHEVMMRGTFANIRIKNLLVQGREGGVTEMLDGTGVVVPVYDAAMKYRDSRVPLIVLAGKEYGSGSSRDWAAKGPYLLGIRAVIAESFERIHRSNLIGMGILPLVFTEGQGVAGLGLNGRERYTIPPVDRHGQAVVVTAVSEDGRSTTFRCLARIDSAVELDCFRSGGILQTVVRDLAARR